MRWMTLLLTAATLYGGQRLREPFQNYREGFNPDVLALQVLLDRQHLSCNCVDGRWGVKTEIALLTWQTLNNLPTTGKPTPELLRRLNQGPEILRRYAVTTNDLSSFTPLPEGWEARARMRKLGYESLLERLAEESHATQGLVKRLNPNLLWPNPPPGSEVILPNCEYEKPRKAGSIRIALSRREITVFDLEGRLSALFPCSIASNKSHSPAGELRIANIAHNPNYTYNPLLFNPGATQKAKLIIPPGPNNPVGLAWIGLSLQGYGIHGTPLPENIGRAESRGCFRLANWNALKLLGMVEIGTLVVVED